MEKLADLESVDFEKILSEAIEKALVVEPETSFKKNCSAKIV